MNLRKDHYRRARPGPRGLARKTTTCRGALAHPKASQTQRAERRAGGGPADSQCLVPSLAAGSVRSPAAAVRPARRSVSLFFCLRFSLSRAGHRPRRQGTPPGTRVTQTRPDGADGSPHGYPSNSPVPPPEGGGGFNVPARGARGFLRLELNFFQTKTFVKQNWTKTKKRV